MTTPDQIRETPNFEQIIANLLVETCREMDIKFSPEQFQQAFLELRKTIPSMQALWAKADSLETAHDANAVRQKKGELVRLYESLDSTDFFIDAVNSSAKIAAIMTKQLDTIPEYALEEVIKTTHFAAHRVSVLVGTNKPKQLTADPFLPRYQAPDQHEEKVTHLLDILENMRLARDILLAADLQDIASSRPVTVDQMQAILADLFMVITLYRVSKQLDAMQIKKVFERGKFPQLIAIIEKRLQKMAEQGGAESQIAAGERALKNLTRINKALGE